MHLSKLRKQIDKLDETLLKLLNKRAKEAHTVGKLKNDSKMSAYSAERESHILGRLKKLNKGPLDKDELEIIFREILSACRSLRSVLKIAYFGSRGSNTYLAAMKNFGHSSEYVPCENISDVFDEVEKGRTDYGVVPIENSTEGAINYTLDMFFTSNLKICSEVVTGISHTMLAGSPGMIIKKIYSNPQVLAQCRKWLARNYPKAELVPVTSTTEAAAIARKEKYGACIGNKILSEIYGLKIIASSIEDFASNVTRFLVISKNDSLPSGNDKTSILFAVKDKVGALHDVLFSFKKYGINLTKIESRPSKKKPWEYYFFVDFCGHRSSPDFIRALRALEKQCLFVKILGSYPRES